jgi:DNA-binding NarL/FixJ family response regulator
VESDVAEQLTDRIVVQVVDDTEPAAVGLAVLLDREKFRVLDRVGRVEDVDVAQLPVVVCDLHLPNEISGPAAITHVAQEFGLPVVATTSIAGPTVIVNSIGSGASSFVSKDGPFTAHIWTEAIVAAAQHLYFINASLAAAILADITVRPLPENDDLPQETRASLHSVLNDADSLQTQHHRDPQNKIVQHVNRQVWRISTARRTRYSVDPGDLRELAVLFRQGMSWAAAMAILGWRDEGTVRERISKLQKQLADQIGDAPSPLLAMRPRDFIVHLLELDEAGGTILPCERTPFETRKRPTS